MSALNYSRRLFLRTAGIAGGGLVVGFSLSGCSASEIPLQPLADAYASLCDFAAAILVWRRNNVEKNSWRG